MRKFQRLSGIRSVELEVCVERALAECRLCAFSHVSQNFTYIHVTINITDHIM